uniref:Maternal effect embryo arrest 9 n=2 Tax=Davidia involucrata TaxID=16924 RepID=A0A5B6ZIT9_DAVIN
MEELLRHFTFLSDQALQDKNFDPYAIEDLMKLFEIEAYKAWAAVELEQDKEVQEAENSMKEAENYLDSAMESAMEEFRRFEEELDRQSKAELYGLVQVAESARKMGKSMEKAATIASKKYIEAALNSAGASMKSAWKGLSNNSNKVHPS